MEGRELITSQTLAQYQLNEDHLAEIVRAVAGGSGNLSDIYPLSPLQEGLLFHGLLNEKQDTYILSVLFELASREQVPALAAALQRVVDRHEILRSAILWQQLPQALHVVHRRATLPVSEFALDADRDLSAQLRELTKPLRCALRLDRAPLLQLEVAPHPHGPGCFAVLRVHHVACDHQSLRTIVAETLTILEGRGTELPEPVSFREHTEHAQIHAQSAAAAEFFRSKLAGVHECTAPFGLSDVHGDGACVLEANAALDARHTQLLRAQARKFNVSIARLLHAAWALVVARTSGRSDVVFGTVILAGRRRGGGARCQVGMSVNTLPLRISLAELTAQELVSQVDRQLHELLAHDQASLTLAQQSSGCSAPLFAAILNHRRSPALQDRAHMPGGDIVVRERGEAWTNYPIAMTVDDTGDRLDLLAQTHHTIDPRRIIGYLEAAAQSLAEALERAPQTPLAELSILPASERREILEVFNATGVRRSVSRLVHELFEEQVERDRERVAVVHKDDELSYAALNRRANQLARFLREHGVGPDEPVGVCLERGVAMVIALLAILKAGGAYVPLDPNYPSERLQYMLQDAAPRIVLTHERLSSLLQSSSAQMIALETVLATTVDYATENLSAVELGLSPENLLYVIYTSGSTGQPKGTAMPQGAMMNLIEWQREALRTDRPRVLQFAALSFDVAFQEIFSTLAIGGTLVLVDEWVRRDPRALLELLRDQRVERLFVPPLMLQGLAECAQGMDCVPPALRDIVTAGEQLRITPEISWLCRRLPDCLLHNHYGPTETHVVTALTMAGDPQRWPLLPSIGRPIDNTQIYILDERGEPTPIGVSGEIHIAGANLARGYRHRDDLTAQRFVRNPFSAVSGSRMYRTGDLGCWRADGTIDYLGRNDDQVKVRGFRVELGEIEAQLMLHEGVREAAVVARSNGTGQRQLIAYIVAREGCSPGVAALRSHLQAALPEYMLPSGFVTLQRLPLTPSGKLDRRNLPAPEPASFFVQTYEPPCGEVEELLAQIWTDLLRIARVGRADNFFDLGGHSLLVMQVASRMQNALGVRLPIKDLFELPVLRDLAEHVAGLRRAQLLQVIAGAGSEVGDLLEDLMAMPESRVEELLRGFAAAGRP